MFRANECQEIYAVNLEFPIVCSCIPSAHKFPKNIVVVVLLVVAEDEEVER